MVQWCNRCPLPCTPQDPSSIPAVESETDRHNRIIEEDLDAILERAEVVGNASEYEQLQQQQGGDGAAATAAAAGGAGDLLTSFNVATFKNEEDDATFWSRLIPVVGRPKEEHEVRVDSQPCSIHQKKRHVRDAFILHGSTI